MHISKNVSLRDRNSFGFDVSAEYFCSASSIDEVREALTWQQSKNLPILILGSGSNTVFTRNVSGLVLHIAIDTHRTSIEKNTAMVYVGAGVNWHSLVKATVSNGQFGLENLALIPGNCGAAPIQNIGAYGKEICDNLISVDVIHQATGETTTLTKSDCDFGYRHSVFKTAAGSEFIILGVQLELSTLDNPVISYDALREALNLSEPDADISAERVLQQVCALRSSKLPDPATIGNAGSFFKNPILSSQRVDTLRKKYPDLPVYSWTNGCYKVPAAWLIDQAGWKGHRADGVGVHDRQALVLVNHGNGNGKQIAVLANEIYADIKDRYDIELEREPVMY